MIMHPAFAHLAIHFLKKVQTIGCDKVQREDINQAAVLSDAMVAKSKLYLDSLKPDPDRLKDYPRYSEHFGVYGPIVSDIVKTHFGVIQGQATLLTYDCTACTTKQNYASSQAYVNLEENPRKINLCGEFWKPPPTNVQKVPIGRYRAGIIILENLKLHKKYIEAKLHDTPEKTAKVNQVVKNSPVYNFSKYMNL